MEEPPQPTFEKEKVSNSDYWSTQYYMIPEHGGYICDTTVQPPENEEYYESGCYNYVQNEGDTVWRDTTNSYPYSISLNG